MGVFQYVWEYLGVSVYWCLWVCLSVLRLCVGGFEWVWLRVLVGFDVTGCVLVSVGVCDGVLMCLNVSVYVCLCLSVGVLRCV